jgi:hypothetical protein
MVLWCCGVMLKYPPTKCPELVFCDYIYHKISLICISSHDYINYV